jgi:DNA invertase Pin-like site-specific DNA recombinase/ribosomal protein L37AE/L43A
MPHRAVVYLRISDDRAGDELGVTRQREDCLKLIQQRAWDLVEVLTDNDTSAKGTAARPGFDAALEALASGAADVLVGWNLDRVTRNRRDTLRLMELGQEHGITIALVRGSDMDLSTPSGRLVAGVLAEVARSEIDTKSDRQIRAYRQAAEQGKPHFVARPYGYTRRGEIIEDEAGVLNRMAEHFLSGWSTTAICDWLNEEGIAAASGGAWSRRVVKDHLLSKRNAGIRVYKGQEYPGIWTPIYTMQMHERLVAEWRRRHGDRDRPRAENHRYLLTGLLICGKCGAKMAGGANHDHAGLPSRQKYRCIPLADRSGCGNLMRVAETLDHLVTESLLYRLDSPQMQAALLQQESRADEIAPLQERQSLLRGRLEALLEDYADGTLNKADYVRARERVATTLRDTEQALEAIYSSEQAGALLSPATPIREAWDRNPLGWRRKLVALVIESITVHPSRKRSPYVIGDRTYKFDPEAVEIRWRH